MNRKLNSPFVLYPKFVGPKIIKSMLPFLLAGILLGFFFPKVSSFPFYQVKILKPVGWIFICLGIIVYFTALIQFIRGFQSGKLITNGVYSLSRNPIYSSWILLILPGIAMASNNWVFLSGALVMYISLRLSIDGEEQELEKIFGKYYLQYKSEVNRVFFIPTWVRKVGEKSGISN